MERHCAERSVLGIYQKDGACAEYLTLPEKNLHLLPDDVSDEEAVCIEPLAAGFEIIEQITVTPHNRVCVLGDGKLGLLVAQVLFLTGCHLTVYGKHRHKLSLIEKRGISTVCADDIKERDYDIVVDCTGSPSGVVSALQIVRPTGRVVIKTTTAHPRIVDLNHVVIQELNLTGSRCGPFPPAIRAIEEGKVEVSSIISREYPLEEGVEAFRQAAEKGELKVIVRIC